MTIPIEEKNSRKAASRDTDAAGEKMENTLQLFTSLVSV
jgi:hypothetical protein